MTSLSMDRAKSAELPQLIDIYKIIIRRGNPGESLVLQILLSITIPVGVDVEVFLSLNLRPLAFLIRFTAS